MTTDANTINGTHSVIPGGYNNEVTGDFSLAFGRNVTVSTNYVSAFYDTLHPGVVRITDVIILTPRSSEPADIEGSIYYDSGDHMLKVYDGTNWQDCW